MTKKILAYSSLEGMRESFKLILGDDHEIILTDSTEQCTAILQNTEVRIFLFDVDGETKTVDFVKAAKTAHPSTKIIAISNNKNENMARDTVAAGAHGYIIKPIKCEELLKLCKA